MFTIPSSFDLNAPDIAVDITASNIMFDVAGTIPKPSNSPGSVFI